MTRRDEIAAKHHAVADLLERSNLDALVLTQRYNFAWYTAGGQNYVNHASETGAASLVVTRDGAVCVANNIEATRLQTEELAESGIPAVVYSWWDPQASVQTFRGLLAGTRFAADATVAGLPDGVVPMPPDFDQLRQQLLAPEVERYRQVGRATVEVVESACREFHPDGSEFDLAAMLAQASWARGLRPHVLLVAGDDRLDQWRHPVPTRQPIRRRAMAVVCCEGYGLICSATRLLSFGGVEAGWHERQRAVCRVDAVMMANTRPGRTLGDVFAAAQQAYAQAGFPDGWKHHHQGGPTGYRTREGRATPGNPSPIRPNQAFAWNPSLVAAKSEDTIITTESGVEILTASGSWPSIRLEVDGLILERPDILVR